jgi:uncharacterized membrane protein
MPTASSFLTEPEKDRIVDVIRQAEAHTTGEIRIHLENHCRFDVMKRAISVFHELKMDRTKFRNGILIYIAVKDKKFAIIGDEAVVKKTNPVYWTRLSEKLHDRFAAHQFANGIVEVIEATGQILSKYFPNLENYLKNELPDDISFD